MLDADPLNPQRVFRELSPRLPDGAILTADSGSSANWFARDLKMREGMMASLSGTLATMGPGVPYAIAAKFAHPDRPVIALVGDGAMQMNGMNELITVAKYWRALERPAARRARAATTDDLNQVTWEQRAMAGDPKFDGLAGAARLPVRALRGAARPARASASTTPTRSAPPGTRRSPPTGRSCSRRSPTPRCRRCRRTSRSSRRENFAQRPGPARPGSRRDDQGVVQAEDRGVRSRAGERDRSAVAGRRRAPRRRRRTPIPTDAPESDGTLDWDSTTIVVVEAHGGGRDGPRLHATRRPAAAQLVDEQARRRSSRGARRARGRRGAGRRWRAALRNAGRPGIGVDGALGGRRRALGPEGAPARAAARRRCSAARATRCRSTAAAASLATRRRGCATSSAAGSSEGIPRVKMKVGREPGRRPEPARRGARGDRRRRRAVSSTPTARYARKQALRWARALRARVGRHLVRGAGQLRTTSTACASCATTRPAGIDVAAGEYGYVPADFRDLLEAVRRLPAGRRHALRRDHRLPAGGGARARRTGSTLSGALRAGAAPRTPAAPCRALATSSGSTTTCGIEPMLFDGVPRAGGRRAAARPLAARPRARAASAPTRERVRRMSVPSRQARASACRRSARRGRRARARARPRARDRRRGALRRRRPRALRGDRRRTTASCRSASSSRARSTTSSRRSRPAASTARRCSRAAAAPSLAGQTTNVAVVIDFSKYLNRDRSRSTPSAKLARVRARPDPRPPARRRPSRSTSSPSGPIPRRTSTARSAG